MMMITGKETDMRKRVRRGKGSENALTNEDIYQTRIVTRQKGSWRWQEAYGVVEYTRVRTVDGRSVWRSTNVLVGKASIPQLRRLGFGFWDLRRGSLHHKPVVSDSPWDDHQTVR